MGRETDRHIVKGLKFTAAALLSIVLAKELGLLYAPTAGIITILSIQNTKRREQLLSDDLLARKQENLTAQKHLKGGATC